MQQNRKTLIIYVKLKFKDMSFLSIIDTLKQNPQNHMLKNKFNMFYAIKFNNYIKIYKKIYFDKCYKKVF